MRQCCPRRGTEGSIVHLIWKKVERKMPFDPGRYAAWRKLVPFTDEPIARVLEAEAEELSAGADGMYRYLRRIAARCRQGWVSSWAVRRALPRLVTACAVCGKTAHYRVGSSGRCRVHKLVRVVPAGTRGDLGRGRIRA